MPSFDIVSEVDMHEVANAVDQANREVSTRFDFKGSNAQFELNDNLIRLSAEVEFQINQMQDILQNKLTKRNVDILCLKMDDIQTSGQRALQTITLRQGLETLLAKSIVRKIKDEKLKVQAAIQGEKVRVSGKKRDDLQQVMQLVREMPLDLPLQFNNFRD